MEHVNNDMDDLFRKAGERYPLKTSESDWEGVLSKLQEEIAGESGNFSEVQLSRSSSKRRWLLLLLLIPVGIFSVVYFSPNKRVVIPEQTKNQTKSEQLKSSIDKGASGQKDMNAVNLKENRASTGLINHDVAGSGNKEEIFSGNETQLADAGKSGVPDRPLNGRNPEMAGDLQEKSWSLPILNLNKNPSVNGIPFPPQVGIDLSPNNKTAASLNKENQKKNNSSKGIYATIIGGPDLSTVAFQSTTQAGYSIGALLGYRFNKRIAIETGLLWDKKYYYSSGEYFDKSKTNIPPSVNILQLTGNCNMFEIPLTFRYDFATRKNHGFFASAGLSSYLMKKENYTYDAKIDYAPRPIYDTTYSRTYTKASNYILSVVQLSAGYEFAIGENTRIRIEPYMKIPLQGIGTGSMPISSAGLYFGISHSFR
jgi:hypothetical protein